MQKKGLRGERGDMSHGSTERAHPSIVVRNNMKPGDLGAVVYLHGKLYGEEYGFDHTFEPYVAIPLSDFVRSHSDREQIWIVEKDDLVRGSVAIVKHSETEAQLRWLILHPHVRGFGMGKKLVREAITFSKRAGFNSIFLWTVRGLEAATGIYLGEGFRRTESKTHTIWGKELTEERYELTLTPR